VLDLLFGHLIFNHGDDMEKIVLVIGCCLVLTACGTAPDHKYLDGKLVLAAKGKGIFDLPPLGFWPPDIIPHPHPPQPEPKDPMPLG
jgi:hypothetical protein